MRFDYGRGSDMLIVADGNSLNMIDYSVKQVQRWPIGNSPLGALLDEALRDAEVYAEAPQLEMTPATLESVATV